MNPHPKQPRSWQLVPVITVLTLSLSILSACGAAREPLAVLDATPVPTGTVASPSATPNYKEVAATQEASEMAEIRTAVALTAAPTWTPGAPPDYPTPTLETGMLEGCPSKNSLDPQFVNCWRGLLNGEFVNVYAGREGGEGDPSQGVVMVYVFDHPAIVYQTPGKVGAVEIVATNGTLFTLATVDHQPQVTFAFDIATRQWVTPPPLPSPSPPSIPTPSQIPTVLP